MYVPAHFQLSPAETEAMLATVSAVDLISSGPDGLIATFLPMLHHPGGGPLGSLQGHVARNNPHWRAAGNGSSMVIARGPDAYVSPNFYPAKAEHGRVVPTWNYVTAQVHGRLVVHDDPDWLRSLVTRLTQRHESSFDQPWLVSDAPEAFIDGQLRAIVGLELVIERIEAKSKLSQNRSSADQDGVITGLSAGASAGSAASAVARLMAANRDAGPD